MTLKITGTAVDGKTKYTFTCSTLNNAKKEWSTFREKQKKKNIILPPALDIVYSGDLVLIYPEWTFMGFANSPQPASAGFEQYYAGTNRSYPIHVTSDEYTYSIINDNVVVILSKVDYTPVVIDTNGFYLAKMSITPVNPSKRLYDYFYTHTTRENEVLPKVNFTFTKLCDIYDNSMFTIAVLCNQLAKINKRFSFAIQSPTQFTFHFTINGDSTYLPLLCSNGLNNTFSDDYLSDNINYFTKSMNWWYNTWSQTIDLSKGSTSNVSLGYHAYYGDGSNKISTITLEQPPTVSSVNYTISDKPVDIAYMFAQSNISSDNNISGDTSDNTSVIIWITVIICTIVIIVIIVFTRSKRKTIYTKRIQRNTF